MSLFESFLCGNGRCFELRSGFSFVEEIENAFVRSFLRGGGLTSGVRDMPFYFELVTDLGGDRQCFGVQSGAYLFEEIENAFVRSLLQGVGLKSGVRDMPFYFELVTDLGGDRRCFGVRFGAYLFEEIENAFVRSFLQGGCLKSDVLNMPFYCELESVPDSGGGGEVCNNWFGGSERYFDNGCCNYFNYYDNVSLKCFDYSESFDKGSLSCFNGCADRGSYSLINDFSDRGSGKETVNGMIGFDVYAGGELWKRNIATENLFDSYWQIDRNGKDPISGLIGGDMLRNGKDPVSELTGSDMLRNGISVFSDSKAFGADMIGNESFAAFDLRALDMAINRSFDAAFDAGGAAGGNLALNGNNGNNGNKRVSSSLFLNVDNDVGSGTFSDQLPTVRDFDGSLKRESFYSDNGDFVGRYFGFSEAFESKDPWGQKSNLFFGEAGGRSFDLSQNGRDDVFAAGVGLRGRGVKDCKVDDGCVFDGGFDPECEIGRRYGVQHCFVDSGSRSESELCFADRDHCYEIEAYFAGRDCRPETGLCFADCGSGCESELGFVGAGCNFNAGDRSGGDRLFADIGFLPNSWVDRSGKLGSALRNNDRALGKIGLCLKFGKEDLASGLYRTSGEVLLWDRFDLVSERFGSRQEMLGFSQKTVGALQDRFEFLQGKNGWSPVFDLSGIMAEIQGTEILLNKNFKNGVERLGDAVESYGAELLPNAVEKGRLPLWEEELAISPEEVRRIRRAIVTEYYGEPVKAEIRVDMSGMKNIINRDMDIDSIVTDLTAAVSEAVASAAEGVHF